MKGLGKFGKTSKIFLEKNWKVFAQKFWERETLKRNKFFGKKMEILQKELKFFLENFEKKKNRNDHGKKIGRTRKILEKN